jgi:hypothetical protein
LREEQKSHLLRRGGHERESLSLASPEECRALFFDEPMGISGDSGDRSYREIDAGYKGECRVLLLIYVISVGVLWMGWFCLVL